MKKPSDQSPLSLKDALESLGRTMAERVGEPAAANDNVGPGDMGIESRSPTLRAAPDGDEQRDFFVPGLYDVSVKDTFSMMDVAIFRLSKSHARKGEIIEHVRGDYTILVASDAHGMATIYDYDIVLFMISHLADQTRLWRAGKAPKPSRSFQPHSSDIFRFCRVDPGGVNYTRLEEALDRLKGTTIKFIKQNQRSSRVEAMGLIGGYKIISYTGKDRIGTIEIDIPEWVYQAVITHEKPEVLTIHRDYFLIDKGIARFLYRLARKAAGMSEARYTLRSLHERSASTRDLKKFAYDIRQLVAANDLPEYDLALVEGKDEPVLVMSRRLGLPASA